MTKPHDLANLPPHMAALGRTLVLQFNAVLRTLRVHGSENQAFTSTLDKLAETINKLLPPAGGRLELRYYDDILMLNRSILRVTAATAPQFDSLARELAARLVGGVGFTQPMTQDILRHWFLRFGQPTETEEALHLLRRSLDELAGYGIETYDPEVLTREDMQVVQLSSLSHAIQVYARTIVAFREFVRALEEGRDPFLGKLNIVRVVQELVDITRNSPALLRKVMALRERFAPAFESAAGDYPARHAASTCVWALLVGQALELNRFELLDLGTSALISKVGFALLPPEMTEKRGDFTAEERRAVRLGTVRAVQALIAKSRLSDIMMRRVIVAYEYQRPFASSSGEVNNTHVYSRIVAVADAFDAMVTPRPWRDAMSKHVAVQNLEEKSGTRYDPTLVGVMETLVSMRV